MLFLLIFLVPLAFGKGVNEDKLCPLCVETLSYTLDMLVQIILEGGVIDSCGALCHLLPAEPIVQFACDFLCDAVGLDAFVHLLKLADLDPIWMCQEMKMCPIHDCNVTDCIKFTHPPVVSPRNISDDVPVRIIFGYNIYQATGTSEILFIAKTPEGSEPAELEQATFLYNGFKKGDSQGMEFDITIDPEELPEVFPGTFQVEFALCQGMCGSRHAHARLLGMQRTYFNYDCDTEC